MIRGKSTLGMEGGLKETEDGGGRKNCRQEFLGSVLSEFRDCEEVQG